MTQRDPGGIQATTTAGSSAANKCCTEACKLAGGAWTIISHVSTVHLSMHAHRCARSKNNNNNHKITPTTSKKQFADKCAALCLHLPAINHLAFKLGVGIFFRNGLLLGLVVCHNSLTLNHALSSWRKLCCSDPTAHTLTSESTAF